MRRIIDNDYLTLIIRLFVGCLFIYASIYKIIQPSDFAKSIWYYHMIPGVYINLIALILPWLEFLCGLGLILGIYYRGSVLIINLMTVLFIIALTSAVIRGISIDCGCFRASVATNDSARETLWRDIGLIILTLQMLFSRSKAFI